MKRPGIPPHDSSDTVEIVCGMPFSEPEYLDMNDDVRAAVLAGTFASGKAHFERFGAAEGRLGRASLTVADMAGQGSPGTVKNFFGSLPNYQHAFDLFAGEWSTRLPDACGWTASTAPARLCEDYRVQWAANKLGGFSGKKILELGPLEGGHSYMLENMGASEIRSIEANSRAFLKCLILKEAFGLRNTRFELGDFTVLLDASDEQFDTIFACGVLYHMLEPVKAIEQITNHCVEAFIWTHYYDSEFLRNNSTTGSPFDAPIKASHAGFSYTRHNRRYSKSLGWRGFCGGGAEAGCWLHKEDLLGAFQYFGFTIVDMVEEVNANGHALLFVARKTAIGDASTRVKAHA